MLAHIPKSNFHADIADSRRINIEEICVYLHIPHEFFSFVTLREHTHNQQKNIN